MNVAPSSIRFLPSDFRSMPRWSFKGGEMQHRFFALSSLGSLPPGSRDGLLSRCFLFEILIRRGAMQGDTGAETKSGRKFEIQSLSIILVDKFRCRLTLCRPDFPPLPSPLPFDLTYLFITLFFIIFMIIIFMIKILSSKRYRSVYLVKYLYLSSY